MHELFLGNFFAQTKALAFGKTADEVRAEGTAEAVVPARMFTGNRPTTSIMAPALTPSVVGQLIALYEHITFVEGVVWGIDSFDQWGVELGKQLASQLGPAVAGDQSVIDAQDSSTKALIEYYRANRGALSAGGRDRRVPADAGRGAAGGPGARGRGGPRVAPDAVDGRSYGVAALLVDGRPLLGVRAAAGHPRAVSVQPAGGRARSPTDSTHGRCPRAPSGSPSRRRCRTTSSSGWSGPGSPS